MTFEIEDEGQGFNVNTLPDPDDPNMRLTSGRGIMLIRSMMDEVEWNESGNQIRMTKRLKTP
jgi:serine/threonine-protein kinase RsbW